VTPPRRDLGFIRSVAVQFCGGGGVRLEGTIVITAEGRQPLTRTAFDDRLLL
jgi:Xaa-Pro aminopeptidase